MTKKRLEAYADIVIAAIDLKKGQKVLLKTDPCNMAYADAVAAKAYQMGASYVDYQLSSQTSTLARANNSDPGFLEQSPTYQQKMLDEVINDEWAYILIQGTEQMDLLEDANPQALGTIMQAAAKQRAPYLKKIAANEIPWNITSVPNMVWASNVLNKEASEACLKEFEEVLASIYHLDDADPAGYWKNHAAKLEKRCNAFTEEGFKRISFSGPGTDLTIGLTRKALWMGGGSVSAGGQRFLPNIPTEEVFTTPDCTQAEGRVQVTKPVKVLERSVEGAWFQFTGGKIVDYGAKKGKEALDDFFGIDEGTRSLGEVALVDEASPIAASGKVFNDILFDENAACHIALGRGYPECVEGARGKSDQTQADLKINSSDHHIDFMIGSGTVDVSGETWSGKTVPIMRQGHFLQPFLG